ncbi:hypothetical protein ASALC70_03867 [Alcanivorax sp. ALC70]|nr:hypothetical protein ASALC70_03867 [Alcanivorax sp. ALC70]
MSGIWWASLRRELTLIWRAPADMVQPLFFFVVVVSLFPLGCRRSRSCWPWWRPGRSGWRPCWR